MSIPVYSPLPTGYIDVAQTVLVILTMPRFFLDKPHIFYTYTYIYTNTHTHTHTHTQKCRQIPTLKVICREGQTLRKPKLEM